MNNPLVSVKMITYNHEPYIRQAIDCVLAQKTNFPFKLIIGEDCSTDGTREIVFDYQKKYPDIIRVITSNKNVGAHKNSLRTLKACRGKYIALCEGDDYWTSPNKLQKQVSYLETHPDVGLVHSDADYHYARTGKIIHAHNNYKNILNNCENVLRGFIEGKYNVVTCTTVIRKNIIDEIYKTCQYEFSENFLMGDTQLWIELSQRSNVKYFDESLATRNVFSGSISNPKSIEKKIIFTENGLELYLYYIEKYGGNDVVEMQRKIVKGYDSSLIVFAGRDCDSDLGNRVIERARKYQIPLTLKEYIYYWASQNICASYFVRLGRFPMRFGRMLVRVVKMMARLTILVKF